jgi:hypothetical protein
VAGVAGVAGLHKADLPARFQEKFPDQFFPAASFGFLEQVNQERVHRPGGDPESAGDLMVSQPIDPIQE